MRCSRLRNNPCEYKHGDYCTAKDYVCDYATPNYIPKEDYKEKAIEDYKNGMSLKDIAEKYERSLRTIYTITEKERRKKIC